MYIFYFHDTTTMPRFFFLLSIHRIFFRVTFKLQFRNNTIIPQTLVVISQRRKSGRRRFIFALVRKLMIFFSLSLSLIVRQMSVTPVYRSFRIRSFFVVYVSSLDPRPDKFFLCKFLIIIFFFHEYREVFAQIFFTPRYFSNRIRIKIARIFLMLV